MVGGRTDSVLSPDLDGISAADCTPIDSGLGVAIFGHEDYRCAIIRRGREQVRCYGYSDEGEHTVIHEISCRQ